jgi:hypothetical protein
MAYSIKATFFIDSFLTAESKYNSVKPIRGKVDDIRPIGDRRAQHMRILKNSDGSYSCRLYSTDVATFYPDGRIVYSTGGWVTPSTSNFMDACVPYGWSVSKLNNRIQAYNYMSGMHYVVQEGFTINTNTREVSGMCTPTKSVVNREATNENRKLYKPFLQFAQGFMEVLNMKVPHVPETYWENKQLADRFLNDPTTVTEEQYLDVLSGIVWVSRWRDDCMTFKQMKSKVYRDSAIYKTVELPIGTLQK